MKRRRFNLLLLGAGSYGIATSRNLFSTAESEQTVAAITNPSKSKPVELIFPIEGYNYSPSIVTDRPGSPRANGRTHAGVDLAPSRNFRVVAVMDGVIDELKPDTSVGGVIGIASKDAQGNVIVLRYVHLDRDPLRRFRVGQRISAGQLLSTVSTTFPGSTGRHLHLEWYINGSLNWNVERSLTWTKPLEVARG